MAEQTDPRAARAAAAAPKVDAAPADAAASQEAWVGAAHKHLDAFVDTHLRNSKLSQDTSLYNEAQSHVQGLRTILGRFGAPPQQTAENQDAFRAGSNNASV
jgi:hypothetical protein